MSLRQVEFQKVPEKLKKIENNFEIIFYRLWSIKNFKSLGKPHPECEWECFSIRLNANRSDLDLQLQMRIVLI
jgi:hypothetical protein